MMNNLIDRLKKWFSQLLQCMQTRRKTEEEYMEELYQMLEDYKKKHGL